jgi:hypothetical protein
MKQLLVVLSVFVVIGGLLFASQVTAGVAIIGIACWMGIMARIAQADSQHNESQKNITSIRKELEHDQMVRQQEQNKVIK